MSTTFAMPPLADALPADAFELVAGQDGIPTIIVPAARLVEVAWILRDHPSLRFDVCLDVTAVDYFPRAPRFRVVYHFVSIPLTLTLRLKVIVSGERPEVPTISTVWPSANWQEREVWDLFGIVFAGHPQLERLLTPDDWEGHPLRKDYPTQVKLPVRTYEPLQLTEEEFKANLEADRRHRPAP
jgi:NADH-quinone oxidoreductase subunit C